MTAERRKLITMEDWNKAYIERIVELHRYTRLRRDYHVERFVLSSTLPHQSNTMRDKKSEDYKLVAVRAHDKPQILTLPIRFISFPPQHS